MKYRDLVLMAGCLLTVVSLGMAAVGRDVPVIDKAAALAAVGTVPYLVADIGRLLRGSRVSGELTLVAKRPALLVTPPGYCLANITRHLLGVKFASIAEDIRADVAEDWMQAEAAGNWRLVRWLRFRTNAAIAMNGFAFLIGVPIDLVMKIRKLISG